MRIFNKKSILQRVLEVFVLLTPVAIFASTKEAQDVSYLYFLNNTNNADMVQVEGSYIPGAGAAVPIFNDPAHLLPTLVSSNTSEYATMYGMFYAFGFEVIYNLVENDGNNVFPLKIIMGNLGCSVNGISGRDPDGTSPDLPIIIEGDKWQYKIDLTADDKTLPLNVICRLNVIAEEKNIHSINVKVANMSGTSGGTLANGLVMENNGTTCKANDGSDDCNKAVAVPILPSDIGPLFTFTADANARDLSGALFYPIMNDLALPPTPLYYVSVYLQNGEQVTDRCKAEITPPMEGGGVSYQAQAYQVGTDAENTCVVNVTRHLG